MTMSSEPSADRILSTFRAVARPPVTPRPPVPDAARHRAPETGEIRIVAAADCARRGRHAAADEPGGVDGAGPSAWTGRRFTTG